MLKASVLHPEIIGHLARAGHLSTVLITDGNYPHATKPNPRAPIVWANYRPGLLDGPTVLGLICDLVPVEAITVMEPERTGPYAMSDDPPVWDVYRDVLKDKAGFADPFLPLQKPEFNAAAQADDLALVVATGETAIFANVLVTIGVVQPR